MPSAKLNTFDWEISGRTSWWNLNFKEWWVHRHLLGRLIRREFLLNYQQTLLGPAWILLQPILTLFVFVLVFGKIIGINTGETPPVLFYLSGIVLWNFFHESFLGAAFAFTMNAKLYSKVYFPRLIIPVANLTSQAIRFTIQFVLLMLVWLYFRFIEGVPLQLTGWVLFVPVAVLLVGMISFSVGTMFSILTAKYRDLSNVVHLGLRLMMFVTPVFYPSSYFKSTVKWVAEINPLTPLFEFFRFVILGEGIFTGFQLAYSCAFAIIIFFLSAAVFSKQSDKLIDVV